MRNGKETRPNGSTITTKKIGNYKGYDVLYKGEDGLMWPSVSNPWDYLSNARFDADDRTNMKMKES